jgi:CHASE2 domain-containing sensor protein
MPKVFISYRREDSAPQAGRLFDRLARAFGAENVFRDLDRIGQGRDFVHAIDEQLKQCDCALVVIGKSWLNCTDAQGRVRLQDPEDFVCREIQGALTRNVFTIPILVDGAKMPKAAELPPDIRALANRNALEVLENRYEDDVARLIEIVKEGDRAGAPMTLAQRLRDLRHRVRASRAATVFAFAVAFVAFFLGWMRLFDFLTLDTRIETFTMALGERWIAPAANERVALIAIDEDSERALGRTFDRSWRKEHALMLDRLSGAGAQAVAFDMYFDDPHSADAELAAAFARAHERGTHVIVGTHESWGAAVASVATAAAPSLPALEKLSAAGQALLCIGNRIGYASVAPLAAKRGNAVAGGLALLASQGAGGVADIDAGHSEVLLRGESGIVHVGVATVERLRHNQAACGALRKDDVVASFIIPLSSIDALRRAPARTAYHEALRMDAAALAQRVRGKVVLVGVQKPNQDVMRVRGNEERYGMELHADVIAALQQGVFIRPAKALTQFGLILLLGVAGSFLALRIQHLRLPLRAAIVLGAALVYVALCVLVYVEAKVLLNYLYHLAAFGVSYLGMRYLVLRWTI